METYKDIELYKSSKFSELDKVEGEYTIEIKDGKARIKAQDLVGELIGNKSRFNNLHSIGGTYTGGTNERHYQLRSNYKNYYFKIVRIDANTLLQQHGFKVTNLPNALEKHRYKAVVWNDGVTVSISFHTPNTDRFLSSTTYYNSLLLLKELKTNH